MEILFKLTWNFPLNILKIMCFSFVYFYLFYYNANLNSAYQTHIKVVVILQIRVQRIFSSEFYLTHTNNIFYNQSIKKFTDISICFIALLVLRNLKRFRTISITKYSSVCQFLLRPKLQPTTVTQHNIAYHGPKIWITLPDSIKKKTIQNLFPFELNIRKLLLSHH